MKLDLHIHSKYSFDSRSDVAGIIRAAKARGLDGAAITDHETMAGVGEALGVAKKEGFTLIPAEEILTEKGEIIGYMLSEEIHAKDPFEAVDLIHEQGGLSSIPHPFDALRSSAINDLELIEQLKNKIDFIEITAGASRNTTGWRGSLRKKTKSRWSQEAMPTRLGRSAGFILLRREDLKIRRRILWQASRWFIRFGYGPRRRL